MQGPKHRKPSYKIILNHDRLNLGSRGHTYSPIYESAYVVSPHIIMTGETGNVPFPDDGLISGTDTRIWLYMMDWNRGIKVFLVEEEQTISDNPA